MKVFLDDAQQKLKEAKHGAESVLQDADRIHRAAEAQAQKYLDEKRKTVEKLMQQYHAFKQALPESL